MSYEDILGFVHHMCSVSDRGLLLTSTLPAQGLSKSDDSLDFGQIAVAILNWLIAMLCI